MLLTAILNAILAVGVIGMVIAPLVWAILNQHPDDPGWLPRTAASTRAAPKARVRGSRPRYKSAIERA